MLSAKLCSFCLRSKVSKSAFSRLQELAAAKKMKKGVSRSWLKVNRRFAEVFTQDFFMKNY